MDIKISEFIEKLSSKAPTPGGGGASALIGSVGAALCLMVANLTTGKKKYEMYQKDIDDILLRAGGSAGILLKLIEKDAEVFEPLSKAYSIPKENPERDSILESALTAACEVPLEIMRAAFGLIDIAEELAVKGSRLAVSDVGVAASALKSALESAALNVYINTKLMKDKENAKRFNDEANKMLSEGVKRCEKVYLAVKDELIA